MKRTDGFTLQHIHHVPYLLPYGQRIAEQRRGMRLNESGVFLWNAIPHAANRSELLTIFTDHYQAAPEEIPELQRDMDAFLDELCAWGMLEEENDRSHSCHPLYMGGMYVHLLLPPQLKFSSFPAFSSFTTQTTTDPDLTIEVIPQSGPGASSIGGRLLVCTNELCIMEWENGYAVRFPTAPQITECRLCKDGTLAKLYVAPPFREPLITDLFHAIRLVFLFRAQQLGRIAIHSASVDYDGRAWLFAGSSGTGKSTHTALWQQQFGTPILNGDLNLISICNGAPTVLGIPWCGTSGISHTGSMPLGGIIHLKQNNSNLCQILSEEDGIRYLLYRTISPSWTQHQMGLNLQITEAVASQIFNARLLCTKAPEAALYMKQNIDAFLEAEHTANGQKTAQTEDGSYDT